MKKTLILALAAASLAFASCASTTVTRVDAGTQTDLSGYWNDTDVRIVCEKLINGCLESPRVAAIAEKKKDLPVFIVGTFRNDSDEHIDTTIISKKMESAIINSGKADFVANKDERGEIRSERDEQQSFASEETAKALANETGADFMLIGSVKTIVDRSKDGKTATRTYYVSAELIDIETNKKVWVDSDDSIKKVIKTPSARL